MGNSAVQSITDGTGNICLGDSAGLGGTDLSTGDNNICIGRGSGTDNASLTESITMGHDAVSAGTSQFTIGSGSDDSAIEFGETSIKAPSDGRYKEDVETSTAGLSFVNDLRPVTYMWKPENELPEDHRAYKDDSTKRYHNDKINHGFIAQEVKEVIDNHSEIKDGFKMWAEGVHDGRQRIGEGALVPILVTAIQELSQQVEDLKAKIN